MKRLHDDADEASSPAAPALHADYVDDDYDRAESRKRAADNLTLWDHAVTCALVTSTVLLSTILLCLVRQKGRVGAGGRLRGLALAAARGDYVPGEGSYYKRVLLRGPPQSCAGDILGGGACALQTNSITAVVLVLFGLDVGKLDASLARAEGSRYPVVHATGECDGAAFAARGGRPDVLCLPCCRGFAGSDNAKVGREMVDRLFHGLRAALAAAPDAAYVLKVEDDTAVDFDNLDRFLNCRPLCSATLYGNCRRETHEPRPYCDGGSGYLLSRDLAARLLATEPPPGPEDVAFSNHVVDHGGRLTRACGFNGACHGGSDPRGYAGSPPACAAFLPGDVTTHRCYS